MKLQEIRTSASTYLANGCYISYSEELRKLYYLTHNIDYLINAIYINLSGCPSIDEVTSCKYMPYIHLNDLLELSYRFQGMKYRLIRETLRNSLSKCFVYISIYSKQDVENIIMNFLTERVLPKGVEERV